MPYGSFRLEYALANRKKRLNSGDLPWLLLAILGHAVLLLIPFTKPVPRPVEGPAKIMLELVPVYQEETQAPAAREREPEPETEPEAESVPKPEIFPVPAPGDPSIPEQKFVPVRRAPGVTVARLMEQRDSVATAVPIDPATAPVRTLGEAVPFEQPHNWQRGAGAEALAPFQNTFNDKTVPAKVEIVDRWLAVDGSHHVVVETPAGLKMCGRARPWDPMQPLVEPLMMWKVCGGDGKVPFKFKPREPLDRDFIVPVAKDATEP